MLVIFFFVIIIFAITIMLKNQLDVDLNCDWKIYFFNQLSFSINRKKLERKNCHLIFDYLSIRKKLSKWISFNEEING